MKIEIISTSKSVYRIGYVDGCHAAIVVDPDNENWGYYFLFPVDSGKYLESLPGGYWYIGTDGDWDFEIWRSDLPAGLSKITDGELGKAHSIPRDSVDADTLASLDIEDAWFKELDLHTHYDIVDEYSEFLARGVPGHRAMECAWPDGASAFETDATCTCGAADSDKECTCEPVEIAS